jgi:hypothetical protein
VRLLLALLIELSPFGPIYADERRYELLDLARVDDCESYSYAVVSIDLIYE